jgi:hypothetical protein
MADIGNALWNKRGITGILMLVLFTVDCNKCIVPIDDDPIAGTGLTVLTPNGDTTYYIGDIMEIKWDQKDSLSGLLIDFSPSNGKEYFTIAGLLPTSSSFQNRELQWLIPDSIFSWSKKSTISDSCKIWIHDYFDYTIGDVSDRLFSIHKK